MKFLTPQPDEGDVQWLAYAEYPPEPTLPMEQVLLARAGVGERWETPPLVTIVRSDDDGRPLHPVTLPWLGGYTLALQDAAIEPLGELLSPFGELRSLRVEDPGVRVSVFVPSWVEGLIDESASEIVRFPSSGRIMRFERLVLTEAADGHGAFRLAEVSRGRTYFRSDVVELLTDTGLVSGTHFKPVA